MILVRAGHSTFRCMHFSDPETDDLCGPRGSRLHVHTAKRASLRPISVRPGGLTWRHALFGSVWLRSEAKVVIAPTAGLAIALPHVHMPSFCFLYLAVVSCDSSLSRSPAGLRDAAFFLKGLSISRVPLFV